MSNPFRVNPENLVEECEMHAANVHQYMMKLAEAKLALEEAIQVYDLTKVTLDAKIRDRPEKYKITKLTEAAITNTIRTQPQYMETRDAKIRLQHEVDVLQAAVTALSHKKEMITNLVSLTRMEWFSDPTDRGDSYVVKANRKGVKK